VNLYADEDGPTGTLTDDDGKPAIEAVQQLIASSP